MSGFTLVKVKNPANSQINYLDSMIEVGYFAATSGIGGGFYAVPPILSTNNGIATVSNDTLILTNAGVYTLNLSLAFISANTGGNVNTVTYYFGGSGYINFGSTGQPLFNYGGNNTSTPGIINWASTHMCSANTGNVNTDIFVLSNGYLVCNYYGKVNNSGVFYPGICTTQITFTSPTQGQPINFNIACNVGGLNLGNSFFTLQMISSTACTTVV